MNPAGHTLWVLPCSPVLISGDGSQASWLCPESSFLICSKWSLFEAKQLRPATAYRSLSAQRPLHYELSLSLSVQMDSVPLKTLYILFISNHNQLHLVKALPALLSEAELWSCSGTTSLHLLSRWQVHKACLQDSYKSFCLALWHITYNLSEIQQSVLQSHPWSELDTEHVLLSVSWISFLFPSESISWKTFVIWKRALL